MATSEEKIKEFVKQFYIEKVKICNNCFDKEYGSLTNSLIKQLDLDKEQTNLLEKVIDSLMTDTFYSILLGLDGESVIGEEQKTYTIIDEDGNNLSDGHIEVYAYEYFHNELYEKEK